MKISKIFVAITFGLLVSSVVFAQEALPSPSIPPDSFFYGLSRWFEGVRMFFTFDEEAKVRLNLHFSELRLAEAKIMIERGKPEFAEGLMRDYRWELNESQKRMQAQRQLGRNVTLLAEHIANATHKHIEILEKVLEKVPEAAKVHIENAINSSFKGCMESLKRMEEERPELAGELASEFAEEELNKSKEMFSKGRPEWAQKRLQMYKELLNETEEATERAEGLGRNVTALAEHVCNMTYKHILVLERVLANVSEQAKPAIEHAINASMKGYENCMKRIMKMINRSVEREKWKICKSDEDCGTLAVYCPTKFGFEITCYIPLNKTEGTCHCLPRWRKLGINCTTDADCRHLICPMVIGSDTPICREGRCACGPRWEIVNRTEWRERFGEELTSEAQERVEKIEEMYNKTEIERRIREMFPK